MRKSILAASVAAVGIAGLAIAAAGGLRSSGNGGGFVLLPESTGGGSPASSVQASPAALGAGDFGGSEVTADGKIVDSYICVFREGAVGRGSERAEANRSANAAGGSVRHVYQHALQGFAVHASAQGVARMQANNRRIDYCEQDQVMQAIPLQAQARPGGDGGTQPAEQTPKGIQVVNGGVPAEGKVAWVIDTGIDLDHPDLIVDVNRSRNFIERETSPDDLNGHGSHVAGTIAGVDNEIGTVGVAAGATVVAVRVLNRRGSGTNSGVIAGVDYVAATGKAGDVANMSLGGGVSQALDDAVVKAALESGVVFALAAGNETDNANNHSPARANGTRVFTIAAYSPHTSVWASFSNFGKPPVDFAEPGVSIFSTWKDGGYNTISGTSMATPHFAGLVLIGYSVGGTVERIPGEPYDIAKH